MKLAHSVLFVECRLTQLLPIDRKHGELPLSLLLLAFLFFLSPFPIRCKFPVNSSSKGPGVMEFIFHTKTLALFTVALSRSGIRNKDEAWETDMGIGTTKEIEI